MFKSLQVTEEQSSRAFTLPQPCRSLARCLPEHTDELGGHELRAELLHLCYVAQKAQHVAMQLLFLWELLSKQRTELQKSKAMVTLRASNPGERLFSVSRKAEYFQVVSNGSLVDAWDLRCS